MQILRQNAPFGPRARISAWRRAALAIWRTAHDPSIYAWMEYPAEPALAYLERLRAETGVKVTLTHFMGKVMAELLLRHPELNGIIRRGGIYPRQTIDISFTVASDLTGEDLGQTVVRDAAMKSVLDFAREMQSDVREVKTKIDPKHRLFKKILALLPLRIRIWALDLATWILYDLNLWTPLFGLPRDPFGGVLVTNIGSLGLDQAFGALVPASKMPMVVAVGAVKEKPVVRQGQVVVGKTIGLYFTVDHRIIDGVPAGYMAQTLRKIFHDPELELGPVPRQAEFLTT